MIHRLASAILLAALLGVAAIPTPESHFGHRMGEDRKLIEWAKTVSYFEALDKASDSVVVRKLGKTTGAWPIALRT